MASSVHRKKRRWGRFALWTGGALVMVRLLAMFGLSRLASPQVAPPAGGPGYIHTSLQTAHRDGPLPVHLFYPARAGEPAWLGRNALLPDCSGLGRLIMSLSVREDEDICAAHPRSRTDVQAEVGRLAAAFLAAYR